MGIENQCSLRTGGVELAEYSGWRSWELEQSCAYAPTLEHLDQMVGISTNVDCIAGEVRNGEEIGKLTHDRGFICRSVGAGCRTKRGRIGCPGNGLRAQSRRYQRQSQEKRSSPR